MTGHRNSHFGARKIFALIMIMAAVASGTLVFLNHAQRARADYSITVSPAQQYQTLQGWGSSMGWWANWAGGLSDSQRVPLADKLFSPTTGIGLNVLRYNLGADGPGNVCHDALANGKAGVYTNIPTYEPSNGNYDWSQDANQRWVLQAAQARGANTFEAYVNSPPAWMTTNSCTSGSNGNTENISSSHYDDYTSYIATIAQHFHDNFGITFQTIDPFNEPTPGFWNYNGDQEGSNVSTGTQNTIINKLAARLNQTGVSAYSQISAPDDNSVAGSNNDYNSYDSNAKAAIAQYNTHTYNGSNADRDYAYNTIGQTDNKRLWMSEWGDYAQGSQIAAGITLSQHILNDEQHLHPSAWVIWQAADNYFNANGSGNGGSDTDLWGLVKSDTSGNITYPSAYYALGNYSKFIRPGYQMIGNSDGNTLSAYDAGSNTLVLVTTNGSSSSTNVSYNLSNFSGVGGSATPYQTTASQNLAQLSDLGIANNSFSSTLPAQSITTFVIHNVTSSGSGSGGQTGGGSNLLGNGNFETGSLSPWTSNLNASQAGVETSYPHGGTYDAYLHPTGSNDVALAQTITAPASRTYTLTAYAANSTNNVQLGVDVNGSQVKNLNVNGNAGYQQYTTTFSANAGQTITVWYYAHAVDGWATLDDVSLT